MSNTRRAGRRERLLARKRPTVVYYLPVEDDTAALSELEAAKVARELADLQDDKDAAVKDADRRLARARKMVDACYEPVTLTAVRPIEYERLVAEHPARDDKDEAWNADTFPRALFLACAPAGDDELTADEWADTLDNDMSPGEVTALLTAAISLNARWPSGSLPNE